jgi:hypothetical protein
MTDHASTVPPDARAIAHGISFPWRVVLTPDVVGRALLDVDHAGVLRLWRDARIRPVLNRPLLLRYLRLLRQLGLGDRLLRHWTWWFTGSSKVEFLAGSELDIAGLPEICVTLARESGAVCVLHGSTLEPPGGEVPWLTGHAFLHSVATALSGQKDMG